MATTIDRSGITPTNDTGTPSSPVGDGTLLNAAFFGLIYDEIDQLFNGVTANPFIFGSRLQVEGFGAHSISAGGTGSNSLVVRNTSSGTANLAEVSLGNNSSTQAGRLIATSSAYTPAIPFVADGFHVIGGQAGGLVLGTTNASAVTTIVTNSAERMRVDASGRVAIGTASPAAGGLTVASGAITGGSAIGAFAANHLVIGGGGSSPQSAMLAFGDGTGYTLDFGPRSGGNFNAALKITDSGLIRTNDGTVSAPAFSFVGDTNTGMYWGGADDLRLVAGGSQVLVVTYSSGAITRLESGAFGTGAVGGAAFSVGRNSSGSGAAGTIAFNTRSIGNFRYVWCADDGELHIHTARPTEDNTTVSDLAGVVVGDQTSTRASKRLIRAFDDTRHALQLIADTPLYRFRYREGGDTDTEHVGILAEESPAFTRRRGQSFDPVNAFGYTAAAIKALLARVEALEASA